MRQRGQSQALRLSGQEASVSVSVHFGVDFVMTAMRVDPMDVATWSFQITPPRTVSVSDSASLESLLRENIGNVVR